MLAPGRRNTTAWAQKDSSKCLPWCSGSMPDASWQMLAQDAWEGGCRLAAARVRPRGREICKATLEVVAGDACPDPGSSTLPPQRRPLRAPLPLASHSSSAQPQLHVVPWAAAAQSPAGLSGTSELTG